VPGPPLGGGPRDPGAGGGAGGGGGGGGTTPGTGTGGTGGTGSGGDDTAGDDTAGGTTASSRSVVLTGSRPASGLTFVIKRTKAPLRFSKKLRFTVAIRSTGSPVDRVAFMLDGRWIRTDRTRPFALTYKVPRAVRYRTHKLRIKAFTKTGASSSIVVKVKRVRPWKG
jgi:hypothetical protein